MSFSLELVYVENIINHSHHKAIKYLIVRSTVFAAETENFIGLLPTLLGLRIQELCRRLKNGRENKNQRHKQMEYGGDDGGEEGIQREKQDTEKE